MRLGFSLAIKRGMAPELSMMRLAFLKNSLINKKRVRRGGAKYNSGLINKKWVRSGRALSAIQSGHTGTPDLKKKKKKKLINKEAMGPRTQCYLFIFFFMNAHNVILILMCWPSQIVHKEAVGPRTQCFNLMCCP